MKTVSNLKRKKKSSASHTIISRDYDTDKIAELARIFSDATRVRIVTLLLQEGRGATTLEISSRLGLVQPRVSSHLSILLDHGLVSVVETGRQRIYSVNSGKLSAILKDFEKLSIPGNAKTLATRKATMRPGLDSEIRLARTCYDHLAGVAGVELLDEMLSSGWLSRDSLVKSDKQKVRYRLTPVGSEALRERGVDLEGASESKRTFAYGCLDWTEQRSHLAGSLGKAVLNSIIRGGIVERKTGTRALKMLKPISTWTKV
jgi:DNA-binding transcriptional ArsR family regulator